MKKKIAKILNLFNILTFLKMSEIAPPYFEVGQIRTLEIHGPIYENGLFCPPLVCFSKKKSEKIFSSIVSSMSINGGGATSECPHSRFLLQKTGT